MLYTGKQIAERFSTDEVLLTENNIRKWANKGLKHLRGPHNTFLYKIEWVEEFIEVQANESINNLKVKNFVIQSNNKKKKKINNCDYLNCRVV